jgi:hypothetical protein
MNVGYFNRKFHCPECGGIFDSDIVSLYPGTDMIEHQCVRYKHQIVFESKDVVNYRFLGRYQEFGVYYNFGRKYINARDRMSTTMHTIEIDKNLSIKEIFDRFSPDGIVEMFSFQ